MDSYDTDPLIQRFDLAMDRIAAIAEEHSVPAPFEAYFKETADFILLMKEIHTKLNDGSLEDASLEEWQELNRAMYADILPEHYAESYANPDYAAEQIGTFGQYLSFLTAQVRGLIGFVFEERLEEMTVVSELFVEVYTAFTDEELPEEKEIAHILYWYCHDYCDLFVVNRIRGAVDPGEDFAVRLVMESDLRDLRYLYRYGEYISDDAYKSAEYLNTLSQREINRMADTFTEGYRIGFVHGGKDLSKKMTAAVRFPVGFERVVRRAVENLAKMGLKPIMQRYSLSAVNNLRGTRIGYEGQNPNPQYTYDHREDAALFLDKRFAGRYLDTVKSTYETYSTFAAGHAGPAVMETFGEEPFAPKVCKNALQLSAEQRELLTEVVSEQVQMTNHYIPGEERSFTIIDFPVPSIGEHYEEIFRETMVINTLDNREYEEIQQYLIDALDRAETVHILGRGGNRTDLTVAMQELADPFRQSNFENCVADVNIPVGEVFTTPKLAGTNGVLHVSQVFLDGLEYKDLEITFAEGCISQYRCGNFDNEEEGQKYIAANVLFHHKTLPMGEFAIGTNTHAYVMANRYDIAAKMPILIAEKTGPHFAVGDTCYSFEEDNVTYNPDGKEIAARDNDFSLLRKTDPSKAYFGCHTDITIPYSELGLIEVIEADGRRVELLRDGRFVLKGTEKLNEPLDEAGM